MALMKRSLAYTFTIFLLSINMLQTVSAINEYTFVSVNSECEPCDGSYSSPYPTIQEGLDNSGSNILMLLSGTYSGVGNVNITLQSSFKVIETQNGSSLTILDCQENGWGFALQSGAYSISGLTIKNCVAAPRAGREELGGALFIESVGIWPEIKDCVFENNKAFNGGAIYFASASITLQNTIIRNNEASNSSGGIHILSGYLKLTKNTIIESNTANKNGGGIYIDSGTVELFDNSNIKDNIANNNGSNIFCENAHFHLYNSSNIDGSGNSRVIVCESCDIQKFDDHHEVLNDYCASNHHSSTSTNAPHNSGGMSAGTQRAVITVLIVFLIIIIIIIGYCCNKYKTRNMIEYNQLLK